MKNNFVAILLCAIFFPLLAESPIRNKTISVNALNFYENYEKMTIGLFTDSLKNRELILKTDINFDNIYAAGLCYRFYHFDKGEGFFWGFRFDGKYYTGGSSLDSSGVKLTVDDSFHYGPGIEFGWRYNWNFGLTAEAMMNTHLMLKPKISKNNISIFQSCQLLKIGYMF